MKVWKKGKVVVAATILAASIPLYTQAASDVTVTGKIWPKAGISLNFDTVQFDGTVGSTASSVYKNEGAIVSTPKITIRYKENYNVGVKSSTFTGTDASKNTITLDTTRLSVKSDGEAVLLNSTSQTITTGVGDGSSAKSDAKAFDISLDLAEDGYTDQISSLSSEANVQATITVSFNGL